jgi:hypothetical protein
MIRTPNRRLAALLVASLLHLSVVGSAQSAMVPTGDTVAGQACSALDDVTRHADLRDALVGMGLTPDEASARLGGWAASDAGACARIEAMPAGRGVFGVAVFILAALVMTDVLGITRIFPFTRTMR